MENRSSRKSSRHASCQASRRHSLVVPDFFGGDPQRNKYVESILVSTGVYNPNNDLMVHLKNLFQTNVEININQNEDNYHNDHTNNTLSVPIIKTDSNNHFDMDKNELRNALSRKNSFISYFDDKDNIPDLTVDNLKDAVDHIIRSSRMFL